MLNLNINPSQIAAPHLEQYLGLWAIEPEAFKSLCRRVESINIAAHITTQQAQQREPQQSGGGRRDYAMMDGGIALLEMSGAMTKYGSSLTGGGSTIAMRRAVRQAANDASVGGMMIKWDTPGGTAAGTHDLAQDIAAAAKQKPVFSYCEDLTASAGYWGACQATKVYSNGTGLVGSIGTFMAVWDYSQWAENEGIKAYVIRAGEHKGAGTPGTEITDEQLAEWQRLVNDLNAHFLAGVQSGRRMSKQQVAELADGRVHVGAEAAALGLTDGVKTFDAALAELRSAAKSSTTTRSKGKPMSESTETKEATPAATHKEIAAACPGADADFILAQLNADATLSQAQHAWMKEQQKRIDAAEAKAAEAKAAAEEASQQAAQKKPGHKPVNDTASEAGSGDAKASWDEKVQALVDKGIPKAQAVKRVNAANPGLREQMLAEVNAAAGRPYQAT